MTAAARERLLATFLDLVRIDSPSGEEGACARYCARELVNAGCTVAFDDSQDTTGSETGNLVAVLPGDAPGVLVLSAHLDCVEPCRGVEPVIDQGVVRSAGPTVLGADDKAGLAAAIECVRRLTELPGRRPTLKVVFTVMEEVGLTGAKALEREHVVGDLCVVLDADGEPGGIVTGAPTHWTFVATFSGRAAHAGLAPERGVSAIAMAAEAVTRMPAGRLDPGTTANIGTLAGGTATNVVAAEVTMTGECRSLDAHRVEEVRAEMDAAMRSAADELGGAVAIEWTREYTGFSVPEDSLCVALVADACRDIGIEPRPFTTGGGSDANIIAAMGVPTLALSCGMRGVHGVDETLAVDDLETLTRMCVAIARRLAGEGV